MLFDANLVNIAQLALKILIIANGKMEDDHIMKL